ncbi:hypothetical protein JNUCC42_00320 [Brevibacterium sp. JNUCC-42]|nr:hypothetical protein JNUCC42_00320 [Brevibacterium sp. JNUCC-42]
MSGQEVESPLKFWVFGLYGGNNKIISIPMLTYVRQDGIYLAHVVVHATTRKDVTNDVFVDFANNLELSNWDGYAEWAEYGDIIDAAASSFGSAVAYYDENGFLVIVNSYRWEKCKEFYMGK